MKTDDPEGGNESTGCIHLWFNGQETTVQVKWEPPHEHITRFGPADVFWWGNWFPSLKQASPSTWCCCVPWHPNLYLHPAGDILRDWQQKPELWEENTAMHPAPSRHSRWRDAFDYSKLRESIHWRGGIKSQCMDGVNDRHEGWERCYKTIHYRHVCDRVVKLEWHSLWLFQATTSCL